MTMQLCICETERSQCRLGGGAVKFRNRRPSSSVPFVGAAAVSVAARCCCNPEMSISPSRSRLLRVETTSRPGKVGAGSVRLSCTGKIMMMGIRRPTSKTVLFGARNGSVAVLARVWMFSKTGIWRLKKVISVKCYESDVIQRNIELLLELSKN